MRKALLFGLLFLAASASATVNFTGNLKDITGGSVSGSGNFVRIEYLGCKGWPILAPNGTVVATLKDIRPASDGSIVTTIYNNTSELTCGGLANTVTRVTVFVNNSPSPSQTYKIDSDFSLNSPPSPVNIPAPPPGMVALFTDSPNSQNVFIPAGKVLSFIGGTLDFTGTNAIGVATGGGGGGSWGTITGSLCSQSDLCTALGLKADKSAIVSPVNPDWTAISGLARILNKPSTFAPSPHTHPEAEVLNLTTDLAAKANAASPTPGTYTKVTTSSQGVVTAGASLAQSDIPNIETSQVNGLDTTLAGQIPYTERGNSVSGTGVPSLDTNGTVTQNPASANTSAGPDRIPIAGGGGQLDPGWIPVAGVATRGAVTGCSGSNCTSGSCDTGYKFGGIDFASGAFICTVDTGGAGTGYSDLKVNSGTSLTHRSNLNLVGSPNSSVVSGADTGGTTTTITIDALPSGQKGAASGVASLNGSTKVVEDPANATATPTAGKIPIADGSNKLAIGWLPTATASGIPTLDGSTKVVQDPADAVTTAAASKIPLADGSNKIDTAWLKTDVALGIPKLDGTVKIAVAELPSPAASTGGIVKAKDCLAVSGANGAVQKINTDQSVDCIAIAGGSGKDLTVTSSTLTGTTANFSNTTPAPPANNLNVLWSKDTTSPGTNISAHVPTGTTTGTLATGDDSRIVGAVQSTAIGANNGVAPLDGSHLVPLANLPAVSENAHFTGDKQVTGTLTVDGAAPALTVNAPFRMEGNGVACNVASGGNSAFCIDADGKFKVSEVAGAVTELAKVNSPLSGFSGSLAESSVTNLVTDLGAKAPLVHTHSGTDIISGLIAAARLGSGGDGSGTHCLLDNQTFGACGTGTGTSVLFNGVSVANPNLNSVTPAAPANAGTVAFQVSGSSVSANIPAASPSTPGVVSTGAQSFAGTKTFTSKTVFQASVVSGASFRVPSGTVPTSPTEGDFANDGVNLQWRTPGSVWEKLANLDSSITGNAATATALAAAPGVCAAGQSPRGVDAAGNATGCQAVGSNIPSVPIHKFLTNDVTTGTTLNYLVNDFNNTARLPGATSQFGVIGVCVANCGTGGVADVIVQGDASCVVDNTVLTNDLLTVPPSSGTRGRCYGSGTSRPTGKQYIGKVTDVACASGCVAGTTVTIWVNGGDSPGYAGLADGLQAGGIVKVQGDVQFAGSGGPSDNLHVVSVQPGAVTEPGLALSDVTTANVSTIAHGLVPKLPGDPALAFCGDGTFGTTCGGTGTAGTTGYTDFETPSGTIDGANTVFTVTGTPSPTASLTVYVNGQVMTSGTDFTLATSTITFINSAQPKTGDALRVSYRTVSNTVTYADFETPSGTVDGSNGTFTLAHTPIGTSLTLMLNGQVLMPTTDYSLATATITISVPKPQTGDILRASYRY